MPIYDDEWDPFASGSAYVPRGRCRSARRCGGGGRALGGEPRRLHYLSVPPRAAAGVADMLGEAGLTERARDRDREAVRARTSSRRASSTTLLHEALRRAPDLAHRPLSRQGGGAEHARPALRQRASSRPLWNRDHVEHVQIDVPEDALGRAGAAASTRSTGAFRDMVVTHLLPGARLRGHGAARSLDADALVAAENAKVFDAPCCRSSRTHVVRGQYEGYRDEEGVAAGSETDTFVALRAEVDNSRWAGVPFYLRTGKALAASARIISIAFREPPQSLFGDGSGCRRLRARPPHLRPRRLGAALAVVLRQAARAGDGPRARPACSSRCTRRARRARCSRPTSASSTTP